jgi:hypothetical protein
MGSGGRRRQQKVTDREKQMKKSSLDVFSLRDSVVDEYKKFATSFTTIHAEDIRKQLDAIYATDHYWPEPLIQINPSYQSTKSVGDLVSSSLLHPTCADIFRTPPSPDAPKGTPLSIYINIRNRPSPSLRRERVSW